MYNHLLVSEFTTKRSFSVRLRHAIDHSGFVEVYVWHKRPSTPQRDTTQYASLAGALKHFHAELRYQYTQQKSA